VFRFYHLNNVITAISALYAGADAFTLAAIFGWSYIRMAMRYTHAMEDAKRRAVEAKIEPFQI
jgi:hypothetical protein